MALLSMFTSVLTIFLLLYQVNVIKSTLRYWDQEVGTPYERREGDCKYDKDVKLEFKYIRGLHGCPESN